MDKHPLPWGDTHTRQWTVMERKAPELHQPCGQQPVMQW